MATDNTRNSNNRQHEHVPYSLYPPRPALWRNVVEAGEAARLRGTQHNINVIDYARLHGRRINK